LLANLIIVSDTELPWLTRTSTLIVKLLSLVRWDSYFFFLADRRYISIIYSEYEITSPVLRDFLGDSKPSVAGRSGITDIIIISILPNYH